MEKVHFLSLQLQALTQQVKKMHKKGEIMRPLIILLALALFARVLWVVYA